MLLAFDIGNTNIVVGLLNGRDLIGHWRVATERNRTADELRWATRSLLDEAEISLDRIEGIAVSSVVPSLNAPLRAGLTSHVSGPVRFLDAGTSPILLDVPEPMSVGADRIANCVAAHEQLPGDLLVIDFGTAITFDLVTADGTFVGGAIAPEMHLVAQALTRRAAQLHAVELTVPESVIGKTTTTNMQAGIVLGSLDLVDGLIRRFRAAVERPLSVLATGGKGRLFYEHLDAIETYDPFLTLRGLRICWERWKAAEG